MPPPSTTQQWILKEAGGLDGLQLEENVPIPELGETSCLIKINAVSLNFRDVALPTNRYPMARVDRVVPGSDGAGTIIAIGSKVKLHSVGDHVCSLFNQGHQSGFMTPEIRKTSLGSVVDGVLRQYAIYDETGLVPAPKTLSLREASTLPCAAVTAWNALTGISGRSIQPGDYVLVQGTGGVSLFAAQFALSFGATVIATTSSDSKAEMLKSLGIQHVINYKTDSNWGETARTLTSNDQGVHHVIEVGGEATMAQSLKAVRYEGVVSIIGFLGGNPGEQLTSFNDCLRTLSIARGVNVGSKEQFVEMNKYIDDHKIKPVVDERIFGFHEVREAYQYMLDAKHLGKIVIDADSADHLQTGK